jgi:hypothetical protein
LLTAGEKLVALFHILQVSGSIIGPGPGHLTGLFRSFPQYFQENDKILPQKGQSRLLPHPVQFIIHKYAMFGIAVEKKALFSVSVESLSLPDCHLRVAATRLNTLVVFVVP